MKQTSLSLLAMAASLLGSMPLAPAALIAYEGFNYNAGTLTGSAGGTGWLTSWNSGGGSVVAGGLSYGTLTTSGNSGSETGTNTRVLSGGSIGGAGSDIWISFLLTTTTPAGGLSLYAGTTEATFFSTGGGAIGTRYYDGATLPLVAGSGQQAPAFSSAGTFMVIRLDQTGATPVYTAWLDPDISSLGTGLTPTGGQMTVVDTNTKNFAFDRIRLGNFGGGSSTFDEVRIGTTWVDVSPVPEPSITLLGSLGVLGLLRRRRPCKSC